MGVILSRSLERQYILFLNRVDFYYCLLNLNIGTYASSQKNPMIHNHCPQYKYTLNIKIESRMDLGYSPYKPCWQSNAFFTPFSHNYIEHILNMLAPLFHMDWRIETCLYLNLVHIQNSNPSSGSWELFLNCMENVFFGLLYKLGSPLTPICSLSHSI